MPPTPPQPQPVTGAVTDLVTWPELYLYGTRYHAGDVLPAVTDTDDAFTRAGLRGAGMIQLIYAAANASDFAAQVGAAAVLEPAGYVQAVHPAGVTIIAAPAA